MYLSRYQDGRFTTFKPNIDIPVSSARALCEDANHDLWVAGFSRVVRRTEADVRDDDSGRGPRRHGGAQHGSRSRGQYLDRRQTAESSAALPTATCSDSACAMGCRIPRFVPYGWTTTATSGLAPTMGWRGSRAAALSPRRQDNPEDGDGIRCLFEDREGDLWIGANGGLSRWRNDIFMVYGKPEGLPSDAPNVVFQDRAGRIWIGFNDLGLMLFSGAESRHYTTRDGLPDNDIFQIRESRARANCWLRRVPVWHACKNGEIPDITSRPIRWPARPSSTRSRMRRAHCGWPLRPV